MPKRFTGIAVATIISLIIGHSYGCWSTTEYYKSLFKTSYVSDNPEEVEKANKILCRLLHLKVQYPDEN
jgi:hypothetical protein